MGAPPVRLCLAAATAACSLVLAAPAVAGGGQPLRGSDVGSFTLGECAPGVFQVTIGGTGHASLVGRYAYSSLECFDPTAGTYTGHFTIEAANGDRLWGSYSGSVSATPDPAVAAYHQSMHVEAGTGRFDGASGDIEADGLANLATGAYTQSLDGRLDG